MNHAKSLSRSLLLFLATACGLFVANIYYNQPLLTDLEKQFNVDISAIGSIPMLTQLGYAFGMLLLTPLGDRTDRKRLVVLSGFAVAFALLLAAFAPSFLVLQFASFFIGLCAIGAQIIIPHVAQLSSDETRGTAVGQAMTGLLLGILLARTFSGWIGSLWGWQSVYFISAAIMALLGFVMILILPRSQPTFHGSYLSLLRSIFGLVREEPILRQCCYVGALVFASFSAVWATLIFHLSAEPFHMGSREVGLFGLLGAAGALAAAVVGKVSDKRGPLWTMRAALLVTFVSFIELEFLSQSLVGLVIGIFFMDAGIQGAHVSNQTHYFRIRPEARSRMNTAYMFSYFIGGALGSLFGAMAWREAGWQGVCVFSLVCIAIAIALIFRRQPRRRLTHQI